MSRSLTDAVLVLVAIGALAFGGLLATMPTVLPPAVLETVASLEGAVDPDRALLALALVVGLFALWRSYFSGASDVRESDIARGAANSGAEATPTETTETEAAATRTSEGPREGRPTEDPTTPETASRDDPPVDIVGERTTARVEATRSALERGESADTEPVIEALRATLRRVERTRGHSREETDDRIRGGAWTDDRIAAVVLGDESAGRLSIWHRLRRWLFPGRTFERRLERTLSELERYAMAPDDEASASRGWDGGAGETNEQDTDSMASDSAEGNDA